MADEVRTAEGWFQEKLNSSNISFDGISHKSDADISKSIKEFLYLQMLKYFAHYWLNENENLWPQMKTVDEEVSKAKEKRDADLERVQDLCKQIEGSVAEIAGIENRDEILTGLSLVLKEKQRKVMVEEYEKAFGKETPIPVSDFVNMYTKMTEDFDSVKEKKIEIKSSKERVDTEVHDILQEIESVENKAKSLAVKQPGKVLRHHKPENSPSFRFTAEDIGATELKWNSSHDRLCVTFTSNESASVYLQLQVSIEKTLGYHLKATDIEVKQESVPVDLVNWAKNQVMEKPELHSFLLTVRGRWEREIPLLLEVERLRQEYGVDWIPGSRELHVIFSEGLTVELSVSDNYPQSNSVTVKKIRGRGADSITVSQLTLEGENTLSDWVAHLKFKLEAR